MGIEQMSLFDEASRQPMEEVLPDRVSRLGEVFTRPWVVELMLDLSGYVSTADLSRRVVVEPACGDGVFLLGLVRRLLQSAGVGKRHPIDDIRNAIRACDLSESNVSRARSAVAHCLESGGYESAEANELAAGWIRHGDFLLDLQDCGEVDLVIGNPPYVRLENMSAGLNAEYRARYHTMRGRSDLYIGFFERALQLIGPGGLVTFICADRWMRNAYGSNLRKLIGERFALDTVIEMHDAAAFESDVSAYPAVTVIRNGDKGSTRIASIGRVDSSGTRGPLSVGGDGDGASPVQPLRFRELDTWFDSTALWPTGTPEELELLARLEADYPVLENDVSSTRVGIGIATGCDEIYLRSPPPAIEPSRLLKLLTASDISSGVPEWSGTHLVNPWDENGLVDLASFPLLHDYFRKNRERLSRRHVAKKSPTKWFRTIDRVSTDLHGKPKLLLPDMKRNAHPVLDVGEYYPHHNLYYITSEEWDLRVLGGLFLSDVIDFQVGACCVKMRGGTLRFQAQYLRKIRLPAPDAIPAETAQLLASAFARRDRQLASTVTRSLYGIDTRFVFGSTAVPDAEPPTSVAMGAVA